ncbi:MAG: hypothetical protein AB1705_20030 [Verrucomicrobiota bacterium]
MLGTVPIVGKHIDEEQSLDQVMDGRVGELRHNFREFPGVHDAGVPEDFQPLAARVIHKEQRRAIIGGEVAGGNHLAVAPVVREGEQ